ncbi:MULTISPECIES: GNAT family N-acetyltransferase [unclassified Lentimicrobium]|uniref:GNAT family N-acetyltransferase n=1 Tax=unclassified Lentimicrobium TaxID=2677434 RepID=UPI001554B376|nr:MULTISPECIES: GNAT family N-acetyltransferase [unclassified Lentimicrobium]NPD46956.1 GNAT family N-acetyltransferase [Lentimicrobium sp. S6]NPD84721.1 GNAT family N-acetyltransferase [Lentimicrobium sp. L6]
MKSSILFNEITESAMDFFTLLPLDWQDTIIPYWNQYSDSSRIYTLLEAGKIIGGGIVFTKASPDMIANVKIADKYYQLGYHYLGYIWISEEHRGKGLGQYWLEQLFQENPEQNYWLSIEDLNLESFYQKSGFYLSETINNKEGNEWILVRL